MGAISSFFAFRNEPIRILILGMDGVGKTTILYKIVTGKTVDTIPTVGFNVETYTYKKVSLSLWDTRRGGKMAPLLRHYFAGTKGIIFVIDSTDDDEHIKEAEYELRRLLQENDFLNTPFLIYANKQDKPNAKSLDELRKLYKLDDWRNRCIHLQPACAVEGSGLLEGLDWLSNELTKSNS